MTDNLDYAFDSHFKIKSVPMWIRESFGIYEYPFLRRDWVISKLKLLRVNATIKDLIYFYSTLQTGSPVLPVGNCETNIALLKESFLYLYMLEKNDQDEIFSHTARDTTLLEYHYYGGNKPSNLADEFFREIKSLRLINIINKRYYPAQAYLELPFLGACFSFFLHTLYADYGTNDWSRYSWDKYSFGEAKRFFFDEFATEIKDSRLEKFKTFIDTCRLKHLNKYTLYLGFSKFFKTKKPSDLYLLYYDIYKNWEFKNNKDIRKNYDISWVEDKNGNEIRDLAIVCSMHGANKLITRYSSLMNADDLEYLRFKKPYLGELTTIKLQEEVIDKNDFWIKTYPVDVVEELPSFDKDTWDLKF